MRADDIKNLFWEIFLIHADAVCVSDAVYFSYNEDLKETDTIMQCLIDEDFKVAMVETNPLLASCDEEMAVNIIAHEVAHLIAGVGKDETGHDELWKEIIKAMGGKVEFT